MENLKSINIPNLGIQLEKIGDFLYHEGPLLSLFKDRHNPDNYYFYKWSDSDTIAHRWLVFLVKKENLRRFLFQEVSLKQLIEFNTFAFFVDINNDLEPIQHLIVAIQDIPKSYLPKGTSFYKEGKYTELAQSIKNNLTSESNDINEVLNQLIAEVNSLKNEQKVFISHLNKLADKNDTVNSIDKLLQSQMVGESEVVYKKSNISNDPQ
jgi:hypothetical protein